MAFYVLCGGLSSEDRSLKELQYKKAIRESRRYFVSQIVHSSAALDVPCSALSL